MFIEVETKDFGAMIINTNSIEIIMPDEAAAGNTIITTNGGATIKLKTPYYQLWNRLQPKPIPSE